MTALVTALVVVVVVVVVMVVMVVTVSAIAAVAVVKALVWAGAVVNMSLKMLAIDVWADAVVFNAGDVEVIA